MKGHFNGQELRLLLIRVEQEDGFHKQSLSKEHEHSLGKGRFAAIATCNVQIAESFLDLCYQLCRCSFSLKLIQADQKVWSSELQSDSPILCSTCILGRLGTTALSSMQALFTNPKSNSIL